ncbi:MAG: ATP-dependent RecD-like DNA helicase, partial [Deltaproteobacteria bacterium]
GELVRFVYCTDDGSFAVARLRAEGHGEVTAVGPLGHVTAGQHVQLTGHWTDHPSFGRQFKVESVVVEDPRTVRGIERYLASGAVKGLGRTFARRVVDRFGADTLRVIAETPERLLEVEGIGRKRMEQIRRQWSDSRVQREVMATLRGYGLGAALANRVVERWGERAPAIVAQQPYRLCAEIKGIGFRTADRIARQQGIPRDDPARAEAALIHLVREAESEGHCFLPQGELLRRAGKLDIPADRATEALDRLTTTGVLYAPASIVGDHRPVYAPELAMAEAFVARRLTELRRPPPDDRHLAAARRRIAAAEAALGLSLAGGQRAAVELARTHGLAVITGGPGTGKTTIVRVLVHAAAQADERWLLAAPTGRAAKRLSEATGHDARTIHRLLEFNGRTGQFTRDLDHPLDADGVLVDEASMIDLRLMQSLLRALPDGCSLVLVGDADQLPSVGAGRVLGDIIASGELPVATLHEVYRQAADSGIVRNAWRVNRGQPPISADRDPDGPGRQDFFVIPRREIDKARDTLLEVVTERLPRHGFDALADVQVLTPMHSGPLGTQALNRALQAALNPDGRALVRTDHAGVEHRIREGDRVLQLRNNYDLDIFNGDVGRVIEAGSTGILVDFGPPGDRHEVAITGEALADIDLAYAISVHKSQGSEYPAVVLALHRAHRIMLRRNLLYTAITRARRFACVIGDPWAIATAARVQGGDERWTRLADQLRERGQEWGIRPG